MSLPPKDLIDPKDLKDQQESKYYRFEGRCNRVTPPPPVRWTINQHSTFVQCPQFTTRVIILTIGNGPLSRSEYDIFYKYSVVYYF